MTRIDVNPITMALTAAALVAVTTSSWAADPCGTWINVPSPNPSSGNQGLSGLAVVAPDDILVLGTSGAGPFVLRWDGASFEEVALPDLSDIAPLGFTIESIAAVGGTVWAAGFVATSPFYNEQLFLRWDGQQWDRVDTLELAPQTVWPFNPRNGTPQDIDGVAPDDVWTVGWASGFGDGGATTVAMTLHWDGSDWTEVMTAPVTNRRNILVAVDMVASDDGWAVGEARNLVGTFFGLIHRWNGSEWVHVPHPAEALADTHFEDVVAFGPDDVWVAGNRLGIPLFMHWDGGAWTITEVSTSMPTSVAKLAAFAPDDIWAVAFHGDYFHYDGTSWSVIAAPAVPGADTVTRGGAMAIAGPCDAWSVGGFSSAGWAFTLAERLVADPAMPGDVDGDGHVGTSDLLAVLAAWGSCDAPCPADLDGNGMVDLADLLVVLGNWG